ncbi:NAD(P)-dependent alcohol dehydrogenase [Staphylococcus schleiferi]|uniref:NAD(P)-dependent alcohol dehydrogenase n=1 Tax=Staphylococcus schleiferi TaxID=1295 RepID=UPI00188779CB|nr:NAD(P)-dependent alcohol dehydrogenase [Staphylococcus schleiferi]MBF1991935.1 NAD(P)-dependent alcohol dehydrogenase [Staphylococcus schleiferi]MBF2037645.1 NAD(P)-dependent alcohol dehydrogenase [Staphylococcus schleiferi]MBF2099597.1 NAD(P)-dependent alcohol dehydrogenase [Staphylococcus schleiferi]MBF2101696.1 NAD(P)-dependent alcohol dehydrogenase [Staphylococcus schleiferi]MBF2103793.1 NAD(P)-dependent alcohol dehydrogenase [Staphylococcus schleiferi]
MLVKSAVVNAVGKDYEFETLELQDMQKDEVIVKVVASGICHSDEAIRIGEAEIPLPAVLGHEGAGIIVKVGEAAKNFKVGNHVLMTYNICGECMQCKSGHPSSCKFWAALNMSGTRLDGSYVFKKQDGTPVSNFFTQSAFSTYTLTNYKNLVKIDDNIDLRLVAPLGCGFLTGAGTVVNGLKPQSGDSIAVFGTGAVGLAALMLAKAQGCTTVIAIDIHDYRLQIAKELGATHVINSSKEDICSAVKRITQDKGVKFSVDTTGVRDIMKSSIEILSAQGIAAPVAVTPKTIDINPFLDLVLQNKTIKGVLMGDAIAQIEIPQLIALYQQGKFNFDRLIQYYKFEEINQASLDSNTGKVIKPVLIIDPEYKVSSAEK